MYVRLYVWPILKSKKISLSSLSVRYYPNKYLFLYLYVGMWYACVIYENVYA